MHLKHKQTNFYLNEISFFNTEKYCMRENIIDGSYTFMPKYNTSFTISILIYIDGKLF